MSKKEERDRFIFVSGLIFVTGIAFCMIVNLIRANMTKYEYYKDGQFGISKQCYVSEKGTPMCLIDDRFIFVDSYYEVK